MTIERSTTKKLLISGAIMAAAIATPALAKTPAVQANTPGSASTTAEIACVGKVVAAREAGFDAGEVTYQAAVTAAYNARSKSLASAYATGTPTGVAAGIKTAWANFNASTKAASSAWSTKRLALWAAFKTSGAACKAPAGILDSAT